MVKLPRGYRRLEGSELPSRRGAERTSNAPADELVSVSVYVRMPPDAPPLPDIKDWMVPKPSRRHLSFEEVINLYAARQADLDTVFDFGREHGFEVTEVDAGRRVVVFSGNVKQMNKAFGVELGHYRCGREHYRSHDGHIHLPHDLTHIVTGVFGLDDRRLVQPSVSVANPTGVANFYNFPGAASGQTIAIPEFGGGFTQSDVNQFLNSLSLPLITIGQKFVDGATNTPANNITNITSVNSPDVEVILDISVAASAAPGAGIVVYFAPFTFQGWVDAFSTMVTDVTNRPSIISLSYYFDESLIFTPFSQAMDAIFQTAALLGITIFAASGDDGTNNFYNDGSAHVQYPASNPWITACGGTALTTSPTAGVQENTWSAGPGSTTGGGVSILFDLPLYQLGAGIPKSVNNNGTGRGVPDLAANANGYDLVLYGKQTTSLQLFPPITSPPSPPFFTPVFMGTIGGTSAVAPLYAALIARINSVLGRRIGYLTPTLYLIGKSRWLNVFHDVNDGLKNSVSFPTPPGASPGYKSGLGWDGCTGWGSVDGTRLKDALVQGRPINNVDKTPFSPAACAGLDKDGDPALHLFWRANDSHGIWTSAIPNGLAFPSGAPINPFDSTPEAPAACQFDDKMFLFWAANDSSHNIYVTSSKDGAMWPPGAPINSVDMTKKSPCACVFLQHIFLFWKAKDHSNAIFVASSLNGLSFLPPGQKINSVDRTSHAPSACVFNDQIFVFWKADDESNSIFVSSSTTGAGGSFVERHKINIFDSTSGSPAACVAKNKIFLFWRSNSDPKYIYWSASADGKQWPAGQPIDYADTSPDTAAPVVFGDRLYLYWKADDPSNQIYALSWPLSLFDPFPT